LRWAEQMTKLLVINFSPFSCHLLPFSSRHTTHPPSVEGPQPTFFPEYDRPSFSLTKTAASLNSTVTRSSRLALSMCSERSPPPPH
jgi:hypothetical protein